MLGQLQCDTDDDGHRVFVHFFAQQHEIRVENIFEIFKENTTRCISRSSLARLLVNMNFLAKITTYAWVVSAHLNGLGINERALWQCHTLTQYAHENLIQLFIYLLFVSRRLVTRSLRRNFQLIHSIDLIIYSLESGNANKLASSPSRRFSLKRKHSFSTFLVKKK